MEDEQLKKSQYINENIISKGYNPEDLSNYIMNEIHKTIHDMKFEDLKKMVERFKNKGLADIYHTVKEKEPINENQENIIDLLYSTELYSITAKLPKDNKLLQFEKNNKETKKIISIKVSDPKKSNSGFFNKGKLTYSVECPEIKSNTKRTYEDFEWLQNELIKFYPLRLVTPLIKEDKLIQNGILEKNDNEEISNIKKVDYLNAFFRALLTRKLFRTSNLLCNFLELNEDDFKKFREKVSKNKYELSMNLDNLKTMSGKINCDITKDKIAKAEKFNLKYANLSEIYTNLISNISEINSDFKILTKHMKQISDRFHELSDQLKFSQNNGKMPDIFVQLNIIFSCLSQSFEKQTELFNQEFYDIFIIFKSQLKEVDSIYNQFIELKNKYETKGIKLYKKKEELFNSKDYNKWGLEPDMESQIINFQGDRKLAFDKMLFKETNLFREEKKYLACYTYFMFKQYNKLYKYQNDEIIRFFENFKEKNKAINGYTTNMMKLFNL